MLMWLICWAVEFSGWLSASAIFMLEELVLGALILSIIYLRMSTNSWMCAQVFLRDLNCSCKEEMRWRKRVMSASYFAEMILKVASIFSSKKSWWALTCSSSAYRSRQWRLSSLWSISDLKPLWMEAPQAILTIMITNMLIRVERERVEGVLGKLKVALRRFPEIGTESKAVQKEARWDKGGLR